MDYPDQFDVVWLAVDDAGRLAAMISAGQGAIPALLLRSKSDLSKIEEAILELPLTGAALLQVEVPNPASFKALSERGLFVYDWTDAHRAKISALNSYELVATPAKALQLDDLPEELRCLAAPIEGLAFGCATLKV